MGNEKVNAINEGAIDWKEFVSKNGKKYEVGYLKGELREEEKAGTVSDKQDFGIGVNWPVGDSSWKPTDTNTNNTAAISRYSLYEQDGSTYKYILYFSNSEHYDYYFYDQTGDSYRVNTFVNRDHYVRYNSNAPSIVFITGS
ncbi:hypothetical protein [Stigmatella erecta]|uniref:Uncharacterized protein n=1 Tax=Stigmatella erecta TaxID=83460 RepID=A0A1I0A3V6_9BACT|nr:hypothetical protein [Stigmatella erecta]SES87850.1 hypothetical protein SAMN05443639_101510 [Stigmatella erecta]